VKIGLISPYAFSAVGGVQGQVAGLALALQQRGHSVSVAAPSMSGSVAENLLQEGITLIDGGGVIAIPANGSVAPISLNPFAAIRVRRAFAKGNFDVIHCHEPLAPVLSYGVVLAPPVPLIATYHRAGGGRLMHLLRPIRPLFGRRFSKSFAVSQAAKGFAKFVTTADPIVVFNGMDLQALDAATPKALGDQSIFFLGRHEERKGLAVLLTAHEQLGEGILYIAGSGPETEQLQARFPESASRKWLGRLSDEDKYAYLRGAAITCAPSLGGESFGVIVLEALAASSIAVISALPGYLEAAAGHALEFPPGDVSGLSAALGTALLAAKSGEGVGSTAAREAGRAHGANWSMDRLAERYEAAYVEAIAERRR
jgi:phosphatidylinositol alpha-mannosyltransferase